MEAQDESRYNFRVNRPAATLRHSVTESIRQAIALGRLPPGARMPERDLCEMTGVSRTLVREALRQLESEGLVEVIPHKGPVVTIITPEQAVGIYQVREVLEGLAAELFATLDGRSTDPPPGA
jgi:DNA-binding GntR family transcriptional regulator